MPDPEPPHDAAADGPPKRERATALGYEPGQHAPRVLATGMGAVAQRIVQTAREAGVPVRSDPALVEALAVLELGDEVPPSMWVAVAETLAWAYRVDQKARKGLGR